MGKVKFHDKLSKHINYTVRECYHRKLCGVFSYISEVVFIVYLFFVVYIQYEFEKSSCFWSDSAWITVEGNHNNAFKIKIFVGPSILENVDSIIITYW